MVCGSCDIILHKRQDILQNRHHPRLVALAGHGDHVALAGQRHIAPLEAERLRNTQARSVEQRHHGGVARPDPRLAVFSGANVRVGHLPRGQSWIGFGRLLPIFGARIADSAPTLPLPSRSKSAE
jgi:hypothetical protein